MSELSLVQKLNWTNPTEPGPTARPGPSPTTVGAVSEQQSHSNNDLVCQKHKDSIITLLVHVIDGFVIEESNVPFKADEEEVAATDAAAKAAASNGDNGQSHVVEEDKENEIANASMNSYPQDKDELMSLLPTTCKNCGGELPEDRAMWGKRFCSVSCSKKYSVKCSQRVRRALQRRTLQSTTQPTTEKGDSMTNGSMIHSPIKRRKNKNRETPTSSDGIQRAIDFSDSQGGGGEQKKTKSPPMKFNNIDLRFTFPPREPLGFGLDEYDVENELYDTVEPLMKYSIIPMIRWNTTEVSDYITAICGSMDYAKTFRDEEIDGQALLLLKVEHMIHTMNMKIGPALKIASHLRLIKLQYGVEARSQYLSSPV